MIPTFGEPALDLSLEFPGTVVLSSFLCTSLAYTCRRSTDPFRSVRKADERCRSPSRAEPRYATTGRTRLRPASFAAYSERSAAAINSFTPPSLGISRREARPMDTVVSMT